MDLLSAPSVFLSMYVSFCLSYLNLCCFKPLQKLIKAS